MVAVELFDLVQQRRTFRLCEKFDKDLVSIVHLLYTSFATSKSVLWKRVVKYYVCTLIVFYIFFSAYCPLWLAIQSDTNTNKLMDTIALCPCRVNTTWEQKQFGFNADPACDALKSDYFNCRFHQGAKGCYRRKSTTNAVGAQCCYDSHGLWITDWRKGAGTLDFYYPATWRNFATYQHFFSDVLSYFSCCKSMTTILNSCEQYMRYRPSGLKVNFKCISHQILSPYGFKTPQNVH